MPLEIPTPPVTPPPLSVAMGTTLRMPEAAPTFGPVIKPVGDHLALSIATRTAAVGISSFAAYESAQALFPGTVDKPKHALVSAAVSGTVGAVTGRPLVGLAASLAVGVAKEFYDGSRFHPNGHREFKLNGDLGADLLGAALGSMAIAVTIPIEHRVERRSSGL